LTQIQKYDIILYNKKKERKEKTMELNAVSKLGNLGNVGGLENISGLTPNEVKLLGVVAKLIEKGHKHFQIKRFPKTLHRQFKIIAASKGVTMRQLINLVVLLELKKPFDPQKLVDVQNLYKYDDYTQLLFFIPHQLHTALKTTSIVRELTEEVTLLACIAAYLEDNGVQITIPEEVRRAALEGREMRRNAKKPRNVKGSKRTYAVEGVGDGIEDILAEAGVTESVESGPAGPAEPTNANVGTSTNANTDQQPEDYSLVGRLKDVL